MNSEAPLNVDEQQCLALPGAGILSIALVGPDENRRKAAANVLAGCQEVDVREFSSYPPSLDDVPRLMEQHYDVIIIDLDAQPEYALQMVESICANSAATVMVYSVKADSELLVRCMRAGAREFLPLPFAKKTMAEALTRASARRPAARAQKKTGGRLLAFLGAKGGDGVTTLACNFAVSLAQESGESTLLLDLDLPLGDAALNLGISAEYSTINALQNASRLDSSFLSQLLVKHSSGVSVLAAPGKFPQYDASNEAIDKLIAVARQDFDNVVIDMGSRLDLTGTSLFKDGSTIYLVIQAGIAGLRNSNRLISQYFTTGIPKLEIVLNRFQHRSMSVDEDQVTKALTRPAQWKIPNDFAAVRRMQHTAIPLALEDSAISRVIRQMARSACGLPPLQEKEKKLVFSFKNIGRNISAKISGSEETTITHLDLMSGPESDDAAGEIRSSATSNNPKNSADASATAAALAPEAQADTGGSTDLADVTVEAKQAASASKPEEAETRSYRGATYVRGADGEWHLQQSPAKVADKAAERQTPVVTWPSPKPITFGDALGDMQLNAVASVPGSFIYSPTAGEILAAGTQTLTAVFTPADTANFTAAEASVLLTVTKAAPVITWPKSSLIAYGTALGKVQLNAKASVPGSFVYTPAAGEVLPAGLQTLSAVFTPTDSMDYAAAKANVPLTVTKAAPVITWLKSSSIAYGTALGKAQLNATASVPGSFTYTPAAGEVLPAGLQTLSAVFTPADSVDYATEQSTVPLLVTRATPIITWPAPESIFSDTALGDAQLNAKALIPGDFLYTPAAGAVLPAGTHALSVTFTPADTEDYTVVHATVSLTVTEARPTYVEPAPARTTPANTRKLDVQAKPERKKTPAKAVPKPAAKAAHKSVEKASANPPVKVAHEHLPKLPANPPVESATASPVDAPAKSLVRVQGPRSVIDVGPGLNLMGSAVFEDGTTIYLVMQPGGAGQQNSSRTVAQFFANGGPKPEIVINRIDPRTQGVAKGSASTALTRMAYSPISRLIGEIAQPAPPEKTTGFSLKGLGRKIWSKISATGREPSITHLDLADKGDQAGAAVSFPGVPVYTSSAEPGFAAEMPIPYAAAGAAGRAGFELEEGKGVNAPASQDGPETRTYKGATYAKGADGQWHLWTGKTRARQVTKKAQATAHTHESSSKKVKAASKKALAKAPSKRGAKAANQQVVKSNVRQTAKTTAKAPLKTAAKRAVKAKAAAAKPLTKTPERKTAPANKKTASASTRKTARAVKSSRPVVRNPSFEPVADKPVAGSEGPKPAPEPEVQKIASEMVDNQTVSEPAVSTPVSELTNES